MNTPTEEDTMQRSHSTNATHNEEADSTKQGDNGKQAAAPAAKTQVHFDDLPTYHSSQLPTGGGKFDPLHAWNARIYGRLVSDSGNDGLAFSYNKPESHEELVFATVYANNKTLGQRRPSMQQLIKGTAPEARAPELKVQVRGKILATVGGIGEFAGIKPQATAAERDAAVAELIEANPRLGNLVAKYGAVLDTAAGDTVRFLNTIQLPVKHLPAAIRDLSDSNGKTGKQHVGALRLAQVLEATMRMFENDKIIPKTAVDDKPIAVDRFAAELQAKKAADGTAGGAARPAPAVAVAGDEEPPF